MITAYFEEIGRILERVLETQADGMETVAREMAEAVGRKNNLYVFGCSHAGILAEELFYRTGGLAVINPILAPGLTLDVRPITLTTEMERLAGYGKLLIESNSITAGDVLVVHSVSGRNPVPVEAAMEASRRGAFVAGLTNCSYSRSVPSRAECGKRLFEVVDCVLDNCGSVGDSVCRVEGLSEKVAASSTVVGAAILNAIVARTVERIAEAGLLPPVYLSANIEGGDAHNAELIRQYRGNIKYV